MGTVSEIGPFRVEQVWCHNCGAKHVQVMAEWSPVWDDGSECPRCGEMRCLPCRPVTRIIPRVPDARRF